MTSSIKAVLKDLAPPVLARAWASRRGHDIVFEGDYATWEDAAARCTGYDANDILEKVLDATLAVARGESAYERDSVLFDEVQYSWPLLAGLMWAAARHRGELHVLDFGGALGSSYFQNRKFLTGLAALSWGVVEQPHFVAAGRAHLHIPELRFDDSIEACVQVRQPTVILLSGVLQCIAEPMALLSTLLATGCDTVILDRTCYVNDGVRPRIRIQHVPASIYRATYPCRFFVERDMLDLFTQAGYALVERFDAIDALDPQATWKGHIFAKEGTSLPGGA